MRVRLPHLVLCCLVACGGGDNASQIPPSEAGVLLARIDGVSVAALTQDDDTFYFTGTGGGSAPVGSGDGVYSLAKDGSSPAQFLAPVSLAALTSITADDARVYVSAFDAQEILGVDKVTGATTVLASNQQEPGDITVDADDIYWVTAGAMPGTGTVMSLPKAGGVEPTALVTQVLSPAGMLNDDAYVYWLDGGGQTGALRRKPKAGGDVEVLAAGNAFAWAGEQPGFLITNRDVLWESVGCSAVSMVPTYGGAVSNTTIPCGQWFTADTSFIYVSQDEYRMVDAVPLGGGDVTTLLALPLPAGDASRHFEALVADTCHVYAVEWSGDASTFYVVTKPACATSP